jgi:hypothetical protein
MAAKEVEVVKVDRLLVRRITAADLLDCSPTTVWKLQKAGVLETVKLGKDGRGDERITMSSIVRYASGSSA